MKILVIDGMGGGIGKQIVEQVKANFPHFEIIAAGTNSAATSAMLKAGANSGATGENAIQYNCKHADIIIGALGIIVANSMCGEISAKITKAVTKSAAHKLVIPLTKCSVTVLGVQESPVSFYMEQMIEHLKQITP